MTTQLPVAVKLLTSCGNDAAIANAARWSFASTTEFLRNPEGYENTEGLIKYLAKHGHTSPFRHNSITISSRVPVFIARQLSKHQVGMSWNETSRRYVKEGITFYQPEDWRRAPTGSIKQGSGRKFSQQMQECLNYEYEAQLRSALALYDKWIDDGVAPEQARMILPQAMNVEYVWTGSLLAFAHVYNLRNDKHAQREVQTYAQMLHEIISPLFPVAWAALTNQLNEPKDEACQE